MSGRESCENTSLCALPRGHHGQCYLGEAIGPVGYLAPAPAALREGLLEAIAYADRVGDTGVSLTKLHRILDADPAASTADAPADTTLRDLVGALLAEQLRHDRRQVLVRNEYHATCSCGEWRAAEPGDYLTRWCAHRDDALLPLLRAHDAQAEAHVVHVTAEPIAEDVVWCEVCDEWVT